MHAPDWHVSVCVQALLSLQLAPFALFGFEQMPVAGAQVPTSWHWSIAVHTTGLAPVQLPDWHVSDVVHRLPSLQAVPFALFGFVQIPVPTLHVPALWH